MLEFVYDLGVTAENPGLTLNADVLRAVNEGLRPAALEFEHAICNALQMTDPTVAEMSVDVELPTSLAGPAGKALRAVDVAWRLAYVLSELDESRLDGSGEVSLDELAPVEDYGFIVVGVELASLRSKLRAGDALVRRIGPYIAMLASATTIATNVEKAVAVTHPQAPTIRIEMPAPLQNPFPHPHVLGNLPGLPASATVRMEATLPGDRNLFWPPLE
jgi:hypothetical protein